MSDSGGAVAAAWGARAIAWPRECWSTPDDRVGARGVVGVARESGGSAAATQRRAAARTSLVTNHT